MSRRYFSNLLSPLSIAFLCLSITYVGCDGSSGNVTPGEFQLLLEEQGFTTMRARQTEIRTPMIFVGGYTDPDVLAYEFDMMFDCRDAVFDGTFHLDTRQLDSSNLESPSQSIQKLLDALAEAEAQGISELTIIGHNTGGLIARAALVASGIATADRPVIGASVQIKLITFFSPFAGIPAEVMRTTYPSEFMEGEDFIENPGNLPANVTHYKINAGLPRADTLVTSSQPDAIFIDSQMGSVIGNDPQVMLNLTQSYQFLPFVATKRVIEALDAVGFPPNTCVQSRETVESTSEEELSQLSASQLIFRTTAKSQEKIVKTPDLTSPFTQFLDEKELAKCGLQIPGEFGFIDLRLPSVIIVHGDDGIASNFDNLDASFSAANYNVFRFIYQEGANPNPVFNDEVEEFVEGHPSLESIVDGFIQAVRKVQSFSPGNCVSVVAHSMGGLIARRAMVKERENSLADENGGTIGLTTVASPFAGASALSGPPGVLSSFFLSIGALFPGDEYYRALVNDEFLGGNLGDNVFHCKIESDEEDSNQDVLSIEGQRTDAVDNDTQLVNSLPSSRLVYKAGHVEIIRDGNFPVIIRDKSIALKNLISETPPSSTTPTTTTTTTSTPAQEPTQTTTTQSTSAASTTIPSSGGTETTALPTTTIVETTTTSSTVLTVETTTTLQSTSFNCPNGNYNSSDQGCGFGTFAIQADDSALLVSNFGDNGNTEFSILDPATSIGSGLIVFGSPSHDCSIVCTSSSGELLLSCTNPSGGACSQTLSTR